MEATTASLVWLIPLAAIISWWLGRRSVRQSNNSSIVQRISPEYFKGLNYLLNEQPDKAIEVFVKMIEVDSETVETHLALGNLFRRRGEVDRAIRIHQNLIARPTLSREERAIALLELGIDYMRSGLFDRAENLFKELLESGIHSIQAYKELLNIYQQEQDWNNAIVTARRLEEASGEKRSDIIAQFYCEKAEQMHQEGNYRAMKDNLRKAISIDPDCARASMIEADYLFKNDKFKQAIKLYKRIEYQDKALLPEVIQPLLSCYKLVNNKEEFIRYLHRIVDEYGSITSILVLAELIAEKEGTEVAVRFITREVKKHPTVKGVDRLIEYALSRADGSSRDSLISIKELTARLIKDRSMYKCTSCGFDAKQLHWQCPSCKHWSSIKPVYGLEGE